MPVIDGVASITALVCGVHAASAEAWIHLHGWQDWWILNIRPRRFYQRFCCRIGIDSVMTTSSLGSVVAAAITAEAPTTYRSLTTTAGIDLYRACPGRSPYGSRNASSPRAGE